MTVEQHQYVGNLEILSVREGFAVGFGGAVAFAAVATAGSALAGNGLWTPINAIGSLFLSGASIGAGFAGLQSLLGLAVHLVMGGLLGALYASAQVRIDNPSLVIVALFYGFSIWFVATFLVLSWLKPELHDVMRTWPLLLGHLAYGAVLGLYAVSRNSPVTGPVSPD